MISPQTRVLREMMRKWFEELQLRQYTLSGRLHCMISIKLKKLDKCIHFSQQNMDEAIKNMHFLLNNSRMYNPKLSTTLNNVFSGQIVISII